ncbi:MAG: autotransporter-associated beta strand repeat-containing protein, partial [Chloroflexi bacterium]|nr:autotransporter-associated beta strand repeat-containing protein [Chloroflexota bacterium]
MKSFTFNSKVLIAFILVILVLPALPVTPAYAAACTWTGTTSTSWNVSTNWSCGAVPVAADTVTIPDVTNDPIVNAAGVTVAGMTIDVNGVLTIGNNATGRTVTITGNLVNSGTIQPGVTNATHTLNIGGNFTNDGTFSANPAASRLINTTFNGTANQSIAGGNAITFNNLTINNAGNTISLTNTNTISATNSLIVTAGTLDLNGKSISVGDVQGAGNITSGVAGAVTLTTGSNNTSTTFSGTLSNGSGTVSLTKDGAGALTLSGNNTYSGTTTLNAGTLNINSATAIGSGTLTINGGTINNSTGAAITLTNNNPQNWNGDFTFTGTRSLNMGTGAVTMNASRIITANAQTLTIGGIIGDGGSGFGLTKAGAGTLTLSSASTYTGLTTINAGTLAYGVNDALSSGDVTVSGGTLSITTFSDTVGTVTLTSGTISGTTGVLTGTSYAVESGTISAILGGPGAMNKTTAGAVTLSGANTYSGGTTLTAGTLNLNNNSALGTGTFTINGGTTINNTSGGTRTLSNTSIWDGSFTFTGSNALSFTGGVTLNANLTITTNASTLTTGGIIGDGAGSSITKDGAGTLTLSGANTFTGGVTLNAGRLNINNASALGTGTFTVNGGTTIGNTNATLTLSTNNPQNWNGDFTFAGSSNLNLGTGAVTMSANRQVTISANTLTVGGVIGDGGSGYSLAKAGAGTLTLAGANTFTGGVTINAGTLSIATINNGGAAGGLGAASNAAANLVLGGGTLAYTGATASTDRQMTLSANSTIDVAGTGTVILTHNGVISGGASRLTKAGADELTLTTANTFTGGVTLSAGTLNIDNAQALGTIAGTFIIVGGTIDNTSGAALTTLDYPQSWTGNFTFAGTNDLNLGTGAVSMSANRTVTVSANNLTVGGVISGAFRLNKDGNGTLTLTGVNTFSGGVIINGGILSVAAIGNGGVAGNLGAATNAAANLDLSGGTLQYTGATASTDRAINLSANSTIAITTNTLTLNGAIGESVAARTLTKTGAGTLTLPVANTFTGGFTLSAGTLNINHASALGSGAFTITGGTIDNTSAGTIALANSQNWNADFTFTGTQSLTANGSVTISASRAVTISANTLTVNGVVGPASNRRLTKNGTGTMTLAGANIFTGGVTLNAGTLNINNASALGTAAGTLIINGGTIDNTSGAAITTVNYPQTWGGDFTFTGSDDLNLGTGAVTLSGGSRQATVSAGTLTVGGTVTPGTLSLTKAGAGALSFGANNVTLSGLTISAGTLTSTSGTMNLAGDFTNNGTFTHNNGTVNFNGAAAQNIAGSTATTFNNLTVGAASGVSLNGVDATVATTLALGANKL